VAKPAATVILVRQRQAMEVLMVERVARGFFGGLMVFPGGGIEPADESELARRLSDYQGDDSAHRCAAIRELAEETSILLTPQGVEMANLADGAFYKSIEARSLELGSGRLTLVSRWVTPEGAPTRYDTLFYLAVVDGEVEIRLDPLELVSAHWIMPDQALDRHDAGGWPMFTPTVSHLRWLAKRSSPADAITSALGADARTVIKPVVMDDGSIVRTMVPGW
jgi:8-oxo-dGTP pyrophosphatase MutT (NUDIX family)